MQAFYGEADKTVRPRLHTKRIWLRLAPDVFEPSGRQRRITRGRIDRAVAEIGLQRSGMDPPYSPARSRRHAGGYVDWT